jgi:hypothetical protein
VLAQAGMQVFWNIHGSPLAPGRTDILRLATLQ